MIRNICTAFCYFYYRSCLLSTRLWEGNKALGNAGGANSGLFMVVMNITPIIMWTHHIFEEQLHGIKLYHWGVFFTVAIYLNVFFIRNHARIFYRFRNESKQQRVRRGWYIMLYISLSLGFLFGTFSYFVAISETANLPTQAPILPFEPDSLKWEGFTY